MLNTVFYLRLFFSIHSTHSFIFGILYSCAMYIPTNVPIENHVPLPILLFVFFFYTIPQTIMLKHLYVSLKVIISSFNSWFRYGIVWTNIVASCSGIYFIR